jgi:hypothetical protein
MTRLAFAFACLLVTLLIIGHQRSAPVEIPWPAPPPAIVEPVPPVTYDGRVIEVWRSRPGEVAKDAPTPPHDPRWMPPVRVRTERISR